MKQVIKRSASSRKDLRIAIPFARVRVILQCWNIKLDKTRDYWTREHVFHGNWSWKICLSWHLLSKRIASVRKFKKLPMKFEPAQIVRKSTQANASHRKLVVKRGTSRHKLKLAMTCVLVWSGLKAPVEMPLKSGVVYKIHCPRCNSCYVGQTSRHLLQPY